MQHDWCFFKAEQRRIAMLQGGGDPGGRGQRSLRTTCTFTSTAQVFKFSFTGKLQGNLCIPNDGTHEAKGLPATRNLEHIPCAAAEETTGAGWRLWDGGFRG